MNEQPDSTIGPEGWKEIEGRLETFEDAWKQAVRDSKLAPPRIEDELGGIDGGWREELVRELLRLDLAYRRKQGSSPAAAEYVARFPKDRDLIEEVFKSAADEGARSEPDKERPPDQIGRYRIISRLSQGGQAVVYRAVHPTLDQELVVKLSKRPVPAEARWRSDLAAEGRLLADLQHPNLARVYDLDFHDDRPFLVLEFIRGPNLAQFRDQRRRTPRQAAALVGKLARAVAEAHRRGIVHRDLKPTNVVMDESGEPRIIDFGLARLQDAWTDEEDRDGLISGTPGFMAPEQARGESERIGPAADLFALGGILYFLLTGQTPFPGQHVAERLERARECDFDQTALEKPGIPAALARICRRALAAEPQDRYATAGELACALERFLTRRRQWAVLAVIATVLLMLVTTGIWWSRTHDKKTVIGTTKSETTAKDSSADGSPSTLSGKTPLRPIRHDFALEVNVIGGVVAGETVNLIEGQAVSLRVEASRDCHLGVWWVDDAGTITQLFPNQYEEDDLLRAGQVRVLPGDPAYAIRATASQGPESLHVVASTQPWKLPDGQRSGSYVRFVTPEERARWEQQVRGLELVAESGGPRARVAEWVRRLEVRPGLEQETKSVNTQP